MKSRTLKAALQIAIIKEEFSEKEILEAVKLLKEQGISSNLLTYLANQNKEASKASKIFNRKKTNSEDNKINPEEQRSQALIEIEKEEPDKYKLLLGLDSLLRQDIVLREVSQIRKLCEQLSKDFSARNSRPELINKLIDLLLNRPIEEIKEILQSALSSSNIEGNEYQQLANYIITGQTSQTSTNE
jgi:hypothetical protein